jgi:hypothetical protein
MDDQVSRVFDFRTPVVKEGYLFKGCRLQLNISLRRMASILGVASDRTIKRWEANQRDIPRYVWDVLYLALCERGDLECAKFAAQVVDKFPYVLEDA